MNRDKLRNILIQNEGYRKKPYLDTVGKLTIGVGRNLDDKGLSDDEIEYLLSNDINEVEKQLYRVDTWRSLDDVRQTVLADMCFNLGFAGLLTFNNMWAALEEGDYSKAADEILNSRYHAQVGIRAVRNARAMKSGVL